MIVVICAYIFFLHVRRWLCRHTPVSRRAGFPFNFCIAFLYSWSASLSFAAYLRCCFTSPGTSKCKGAFQYSCISVENVEEGTNEAEEEGVGDQSSTQEIDSNVCTVCSLEKPKRSHHCSICNYCVLKWIITAHGLATA